MLLCVTIDVITSAPVLICVTTGICDVLPHVLLVMMQVLLCDILGSACDIICIGMCIICDASCIVICFCFRSWT